MGSPQGPRARRLRLATLVIEGYLRGLLRWLTRSKVRASATRDAGILLRGTPRAKQARRVGLGLVVEQSIQWTLFPHFRLLQDARMVGLEHLDAAEAQGNGVMMITTHCGWLQAMLWCLTHHDRPFTCVSGQWLVSSTRPTDVRQMPMVNDAIGHGAHHLVAGNGAFDKLNDAIAAKGRALMAIDMPGSLDLTYLGKPAKVGQGTFRIAWNNAAPIVPMAIRRRGLRLAVEISEPLLPSSFTSVEELAQAGADVCGRSALADAEQYTPRNIAILWPGGNAENSRPNRVAWADKQSSDT
jgi:hypothetical protein